MQPGTFAFRLIVPGLGLDEDADTVNIPIDAVVMPHKRQAGNLPLLIEAKSAGDFTNVNKRRKEEATKVAMLRRKQGSQVRFILFLRGTSLIAAIPATRLPKALIGFGNTGSTILRNWIIGNRRCET